MLSVSVEVDEVCVEGPDEGEVEGGVMWRGNLILVLSPTLTSALEGARVIFVASEERERDTGYTLNASHMLVTAEGSSETLITSHTDNGC